jgi:gamma-glutamyltranspeptidase/glutathione hydrolase
MLGIGGLRALKAAGVPGTVAGLEYASRKYGKLSWGKLAAPAVRLAGKPALTFDQRVINGINDILAATETLNQKVNQEKQAADQFLTEAADS